MSQTLDPTGPAPETRSLRFILLLFGASAAPLFWLGQMMLGYGVTAHTCFPGRYPYAAAAAPLSAAMIIFNLVAVTGAVAGGAVSWWCWRRRNFGIAAGRTRFLALWGIFSSLWFAAAILFNIIGSAMVPPCLW